MKKSLLISTILGVACAWGCAEAPALRQGADANNQGDGAGTLDAGVTDSQTEDTVDTNVMLGADALLGEELAPFVEGQLACVPAGEPALNPAPGLPVWTGAKWRDCRNDKVVRFIDNCGNNMVVAERLTTCGACVGDVRTNMHRFTPEERRRIIVVVEDKSQCSVYLENATFPSDARVVYNDNAFGPFGPINMSGSAFGGMFACGGVLATGYVRAGGILEWGGFGDPINGNSGTHDQRLQAVKNFLAGSSH